MQQMDCWPRRAEAGGCVRRQGRVASLSILEAAMLFSMDTDKKNRLPCLLKKTFDIWNHERMWTERIVNKGVNRFYWTACPIYTPLFCETDVCFLPTLFPDNIPLIHSITIEGLPCATHCSKCHQGQKCLGPFLNIINCRFSSWKVHHIIWSLLFHFATELTIKKKKKATQNSLTTPRVTRLFKEKWPAWSLNGEAALETTWSFWN